MTSEDTRVLSMIPVDGIIKETLINKVSKIYGYDETQVESIILQLRKAKKIKNGKIEDGKNKYIFPVTSKDENEETSLDDIK
jgi:hypothetical protein